jgi:[protein-PII] uridylyltransferase
MTAIGNNLARYNMENPHSSKDESGAMYAHDELKEAKNRLVKEFSAGKIKESFHENYTEIIDQYFRMGIQESDTGHDLFKKKAPFALIAVGGYGRKELCLYSDIDILVLFNKKIPPSAKALSEELFYPLWDLGLELGYGVRTIKDCLVLGNKDYEVLTSLMDARFLCGDSLIYLSMMDNLYKKVIAKKSAVFIRWLEDIDEVRRTNFGDASHLLEPNLKDGIGGLRDYNHILWMAKALFYIRDSKELEYLGKLSYREYHELEDQVSFILFVRNHLHQVSDRKNDRLSFEYQEEIARRLGYKNLKNIPAVEQFLGKLHSSMESIKSLHRSFLTGNNIKSKSVKNTYEQKDISKGLHIYQDELGFNSATAILADPFILMDIFEQSSNFNLALSMDAGRLVKEFLYLIDDDFRSSARATKAFLNIMNSRNAIKSLDQMFETGFLAAFIPEFGEIKDRVQFDAYHIYPVGRHVLETVSYLKNLSKEKNILLMDAFSDLGNHEILFLSALFHDIGKNGKGHAKRGVKISRKILERFKYPQEATEEILFQIENHLLLTETATRRDLDDEKVIVQCAGKIGAVDRLKTLYLLTWADAKATGPRAWNEWIANLVQELFFKILHILEMGELATPDSSQRVEKVKKQVRRITAGQIDKEEYERLYDAMSTRYKLNTSPKDMVHHLGMVKKLEAEIRNNNSPAFVIDFIEDRHGGFWKFIFVAKDRPGLFSDIAGVLALNNINILSSNIYTWTDGTALDIFSVTRPLDSINPEETWKKVEKDLKNCFSGKLALPYRLSQKAVPSVLSSPKRPTRPPVVTLDNKSSNFFTLVEVFASDKVGLLYLITRTLFDLRLDIRIAKTGVKGDQIADVFYVRDLEGQKIEAQAQVEEIKKALLHQL